MKRRLSVAISLIGDPKVCYYFQPNLIIFSFSYLKKNRWFKFSYYVNANSNLGCLYGWAKYWIRPCFKKMFMECYQACKTGSCNHSDKYSLALSWILSHYILLVVYALDILASLCYIWFHNMIKFDFMLSAHSMEEVEALCDRLGVFVNGNLQCIGNPKEVLAQVICFNQSVFQNETIKWVCP